MRRNREVRLRPGILKEIHAAGYRVNKFITGSAYHICRDEEETYQQVVCGRRGYLAPEAATDMEQVCSRCIAKLIKDGTDGENKLGLGGVARLLLEERGQLRLTARPLLRSTILGRI